MIVIDRAKLLLQYTVLCPDPHGSVLKLPPGSGSIFELQIRIGYNTGMRSRPIFGAAPAPSFNFVYSGSGS